MNKKKANDLFKAAYRYCEEERPGELEWAASVNGDTFKRMDSKHFLGEYCWVVYASGFKVDTVESFFPRLKLAFKNFDLDAIARMRSTSTVLRVFNNEKKAAAFLKGAKAISSEGFEAFKARLALEGLCAVKALPGIGPVTQYHLAKNIGLVDAAKPDIWLERAAEMCGASVVELVDYLSEKHHATKHVVDVVLWRFGADMGLGTR